MARPEDTTGLTVCVNAGEVLPAKKASPEYLAVMEWEPTAREDVENCTIVPARLNVPRVAAPSKNVTVPVGEVPP